MWWLPENKPYCSSYERTRDAYGLLERPRRGLLLAQRICSKVGGSCARSFHSSLALGLLHGFYSISQTRTAKNASLESLTAGVLSRKLLPEQSSEIPRHCFGLQCRTNTGLSFLSPDLPRSSKCRFSGEHASSHTGKKMA